MKNLNCLIGALQLQVANPHLRFVIASVMRRAVLKPWQDSVLMMIQSA